MEMEVFVQFIGGCLNDRSNTPLLKGHGERPLKPFRKMTATFADGFFNTKITTHCLIRGTLAQTHRSINAPFLHFYVPLKIESKLDGSQINQKISTICAPSLTLFLGCSTLQSIVNPPCWKYLKKNQTNYSQNTSWPVHFLPLGL